MILGGLTGVTTARPEVAGVLQAGLPTSHEAGWAIRVVVNAKHPGSTRDRRR
jgi:hypothetical protein